MTLLLHTSSPTVRVGLLDGDQIVARDEFPSDRTLASSLADRIRKLLLLPHPTSPSHSAKTSRDERLRGAAGGGGFKALERIVVHAGPGGFTGLRVGVTTANALAYALTVPITGVTGPVASLDELLRHTEAVAPTAGKLVLPVYDRAPRIGS